MRRLILVVVMAPLALATLPATAQTELKTCDAPPAGTTVVGPNYSALPKVASPAAPNGTAVLKYQLDLSPATAEAVASVGAYLEWELRMSDWNLALLNAEGNALVTSNRPQPFANLGSTSTPPRPSDPYENVFRLRMEHCSIFQVRITNAAAPWGEQIDMIDPLQLKVETGARR